MLDCCTVSTRKGEYVGSRERMWPDGPAGWQLPFPPSPSSPSHASLGMLCCCSNIPLVDDVRAPGVPPLHDPKRIYYHHSLLTGTNACCLSGISVFQVTATSHNPRRMTSLLVQKDLVLFCLATEVIRKVGHESIILKAFDSHRPGCASTNWSLRCTRIPSRASAIISSLIFSCHRASASGEVGMSTRQRIPIHKPRCLRCIEKPL